VIQVTSFNRLQAHEAPELRTLRQP